jgi:hypothetical protein
VVLVLAAESNTTTAAALKTAALQADPTTIDLSKPGHRDDTDGPQCRTATTVTVIRPDSG